MLAIVRTRCAALVLLWLTAAAAPTALAQSPDADAGRRLAAFCANCHGERGVSAIPAVPNLAAQNPDYLSTQIEAFASGKRRNAFMEGLMRVLDPAEKSALAAFYAALPPPPARSAPAGTRDKGAAAFARLCAQCHGADGHGSATTPRLAGQQPEYVRTTLERYLTLSGERFYAPMTAAVSKLGAANIEAVVDYLGSLP